MKIIIILVLLKFFTNITYADISQNKLDNYLDISVGGAIFLAHHLHTGVMLSKEGIDIKHVAKMITNNKYQRIYSKEFFKDDEVYYNEIIDFYNTNVGKKLTKIVYNISEININKLEKLYKDNNITEKKRKIILKLENRFHLVELKMNFTKKYFQEKEKNNLNKMIYRMVSFNNSYSSNLIKYQKIIAYTMYKDFTLEELNKIWQFITSKAGRYEIKLISIGFNKYINLFIKDIITVELQQKRYSKA